MAGDWIKMRVDLATCPQVVRIMSATGSDRLRVVGGLHAVWSLFDAHSDDGELHGYTLDLMDQMIGWPGFCAAVADAGWMVQTPESLMMPSFDAHNGNSAKRRAGDQKRKKEVRKMSAPQADKKKTREEKRREENINTPSSPKEGDDENLPTTGKQPDPVDQQVAEYILAGVKRLKPDLKNPNLDTWANDCRKMREIDGRTPRRIAEVFRWANLHDFWQSNILSPAKLRKQFDALEIKMTQPTGGRSNGQLDHDDETWFDELVGERIVPPDDGDQAGLAGGVPDPGGSENGEAGMAPGDYRSGYPRLVGD